MPIRSTEANAPYVPEEICRGTVEGITNDILGLTNPTNDNTLAPWAMAVERAKGLVEALQSVCDVIAARPIMNPGQQALRAIAARPEIDYFDVASPEMDSAFDALEQEALRVAKVREDAALQAAWDAKPLEDRLAIEAEFDARVQEAEAQRVDNAHVAPFFCPALEQVQRIS